MSFKTFQDACDELAMSVVAYSKEGAPIIDILESYWFEHETWDVAVRYDANVELVKSEVRNFLEATNWL